ncbi:Signal transduction histidine kinase [Streptomyces sp. Ag82_O1-12]|uniref:sensor histidine kinase n=1 Tax=Streptomyces sp. Ag82_O1-12 TaxID=1938854 RepID=UPI002402F2FD|nr:histidine kinase [Streptomyces sp. Ag82_O1-12]SMQ13752.1 Signal transduction histidine kinase [Streptomyces sp. Ag82_O1-12]
MSRDARWLWCGSAGLVLGVLGTSVVAVGTSSGAGRRSAAAAVLVVAQCVALRWLLRGPLAVLGVGVVTGVAVWALFPAVTLTGALLAAQVALCVLSATRSRRVSVAALAGMCALAPLGFYEGGPAVVAVCLLAVLLAWTVGQWRRAQRARTAAETRRAVAEERARIAREVHDVVAHTLSVMVIQAGAADDVFDDRPEQARQALRAIDTAGRSALDELRLLLRAFGPEEENPAEEDPEEGNPAEEDPVAGERAPRPGLARLDDLADAVRAAGMTVRLDREGVPAGGLPAAVDLAAYRIAQEAVTNALRHAVGADEVRVSVTADGERIRITVADNGRTPPARSAKAGAGRGLMGMRERARMLGGSLRAGPAAGGGFAVEADLPMEYAS